MTRHKMNIEIIFNALASNDNVLSRTASSGHLDVSAAPEKSLAIIQSADAASRVARNRYIVAKYICEQDPNFWKSELSLFSTIVGVGSMLSAGFIEGTLFRSWPLPPDRGYGPGISSAINPNNVIDELLLCSRRISSDSIGSLIERAARLEWEIGIGPLHPFADACGRTSRALSAMLLFTNNVPIKRHLSRAEYYEAGSKGAASFARYFCSLPNF